MKLTAGNKVKDRTKARRIAEAVLYPIAACALLIGVWAVAASVKGNADLLPMPGEVFERFFRLFGEAGFWTSVGRTLLRIIECFVVSFILALALALAGGLFAAFHKLMSPIVTVLRSAPTMAIILLAMLWMDYQKAPILIGFLVAFPVLYSAFYAAITGVSSELIEMTKVYKVRRIDRIRRLYVPEIMPAVFEGSKSTLSLTAKVIIAAEVLCYTRDSIGLEMYRANLTFDIGNLMAWTVLAILLSFVLEALVGGLKKLWEAAR